MKYYNNNEKYGCGGPFEADSPEELSNGMTPTLETWADEEIDKFNDMVYHGEADAEDEPNRNDLIARMRSEFIDGLELVD